MLAAIYARKSTEQNGVADEQKSVARQVEHSHHYAERKGEYFLFFGKQWSGGQRAASEAVL